MNKIKKIITLLLCVSLLLPYNVSLAHSNRHHATDRHHNYNNKSEFGNYYYHHGMGPHLHPDGICPYSSSKTTAATKRQSKYCRSSTVKKVQNRLNKLGYQCGKADGSCGARTKKAIKKFQKKKGLTVNGKINKTLLKKLKIKI